MYNAPLLSENEIKTLLIRLCNDIPPRCRCSAVSIKDNGILPWLSPSVYNRERLKCASYYFLQLLLESRFNDFIKYTFWIYFCIGINSMSGSISYYQTFLGETINCKYLYFKFPSISCSLLLCCLSIIHFPVFRLYLYLEVDDSPHSSLAVT